MKDLKRHSKTLIILLLPVILGVFNGKCSELLVLLFYIPCEVPAGVDYTSTAMYHSYQGMDYGTVYVTANGAVYLSFNYCEDPMIVYTVPGTPRLNDIKQGFWRPYNIVVGNNGTIVRSSQTDPAWRVIPSPIIQNLNKVIVLSREDFSDHLLAVGNAGTILVSRDTGLTWSQKSFPHNVNLRDIEYYSSDDTNRLRVVGDGLSSYHTTNGGTTWIMDTLNLGLDPTELGIDMSTGGPNLNTIQFVNNSTGYIAGQAGFLYKTVNGGGFFFTRVISGLDNIVDMHFTSPDSGFVISTNGKIKFTDDGGNTWFENNGVNSLINSRQLNSISVISENFGYINGANGLLILTARDSALIGIHNEQENIPSEFKLAQNHPNPFNPMTNIGFVLSKTSLVRLVIHDMLGREVETLVNNRMQPGEHNVEWNGAAYPSGVYFYKMDVDSPAGKFSETKKMVLVK
jgi:photosystem II stability/assembly factor-like uncharacterized protein